MKKIISAILIVALMISLSAIAISAEVQTILLGDSDGDGSVLIIDATIIQRHLVNLLQLSDERLKAADINGDGIDITDATYIQRWLASMSVPYKIGEPMGSDEDTPDTLVVYFSRTGNTEPLAEYAAEILGADTFEIEAEIPYTDEDIQYFTDCRADREQNDPNVRPAIVGQVENMEQYDTIILAYPIWHRQAPRIIYTFMESYDFSGKTIIPFCTSIASDIGTSATNLHTLAPNVVWKDGKRFPAGTTKETIAEWLSTFDIGIDE